MKIIGYHLSNTYIKYVPQNMRYYIKKLRRFLTNKYTFLRYKKPIYSNLEKHLRNVSELSIWFLPTHTWFSSAFQRPQQMARALAEIGCTVIYYEPWDNSQLIINKDGLRERRFKGIRQIAPLLYLLRCPENLLCDYLSYSQPDALIMIWPYQDEFILSDISSIVIYEMIDDHELFSSHDDPWIKNHQQWVEKADIMVATADDLLYQLKSQRPDTLLLPNGVRKEDWVLTEFSPIPEDISEARRAEVVVGYYGSIAEWFDWEMWEVAAKTKSVWSFVLIGPPFNSNSNRIIERMKLFKNVYYLGPKPYKELPIYLAQFDIATIPFVINKITNACSPIKLFEYMAAGKPIVASPMHEILKYKSVLLADNPEVFVNQLDKALIIKDNPEYRSVLKQEAEANTWRSRAESLRRTIESVRRQQNNIPRRKME